MRNAKLHRRGLTELGLGGNRHLTPGEFRAHCPVSPDFGVGRAVRNLQTPSHLFCATGKDPAGGLKRPKCEGVLWHCIPHAEGLLLFQPQLCEDPASAGNAALRGGAAGHCALSHPSHRAGGWGCQSRLLPPGECRAALATRSPLQQVCVSTGPFAGPETWSRGVINPLLCLLPFRFWPEDPLCIMAKQQYFLIHH